MTTLEPAPTIDLARTGTPEHVWQPFCNMLPRFRWPACSRLVVVTPHPDDETFGCGGLIAAAALRTLPITIVSVTDGEAATPMPGLAALRRRELAEAVHWLAPDALVRLERLGLPDGGAAALEAPLRRTLRDLVTSDDLVVAPIVDDGHPDHEAVGRAAAEVARERGAALRAVAIWAWHWQVPPTTSLARGTRLQLGSVVRGRKRRAIRAYRTQLAGADPVVPGFMLDRFDRPSEVLVAPEWSR